MCSFELWTTLQSSSFLQWWNFLLILCHVNFRLLLYKSVSQILQLMLLLSEKVVFSWTYLLEKTPRTTKILISLVWSKILKIWYTLFEIIQIKVQCNKSYFKFFLPQEVGAFGNNIEKEPQKSRPNLKNKMYIIYLQRIFALPAIPWKW